MGLAILKLAKLQPILARGEGGEILVDESIQRIITKAGVNLPPPPQINSYLTNIKVICNYFITFSTSFIYSIIIRFHEQKYSFLRKSLILLSLFIRISNFL